MKKLILILILFFVYCTPEDQVFVEPECECTKNYYLRTTTVICNPGCNIIRLYTLQDTEPVLCQEPDESNIYHPLGDDIYYQITCK